MRIREDADIVVAFMIRAMRRYHIHIRAEVAHGEHDALRESRRTRRIHDCAEIIHRAVHIMHVSRDHAHRMFLDEQLVALCINRREISARFQQFPRLEVNDSQKFRHGRKVHVLVH